MSTTLRPGARPATLGAPAFLAILLLVVGTGPLAAQAAAPRGNAWWHQLTPAGPRAVGFEVRVLRDASRPLNGAPRPIQAAVWYPARTAAGRPLSFRDYFRLAAAETSVTDTAAAADAMVRGYSEFLTSRGIGAADRDAWFDAPMLARRGAPAAPETFPLVLLAQGNGQSAADQSVLAEYLASHGFIVVTSPSQARISGQPQDEAHAGSAAEEQAGDLLFLKDAVRELGAPRAGRVGVAGHSFGARSALLAAMRDPGIVSMVSLDGGIGTATAREAYESAPWFRPAAFRASLLHVFEDVDPRMTPEWTTLKRLDPSLVWVARTSAMRHHLFTVLGAVAAAFPAARAPLGAGDSTGAAYGAILDLTRAWLDAGLKGDDAGMRGWNDRRAALRVQALSELVPVPGR